ncbi:MAG: hypothetical protein WA892_12395 [Ornithinimicrobium sp.]
MQLLPGYLLLAMAVAYLASEVVLRRKSGWTKGPLNFGTRAIVFTPLAIYLVAAVVLSTASWNILNLTSVLIVFALPMALGAAFRGFLPHVHPGAPALLAGALSLLGLFCVGAGYQL